MTSCLAVWLEEGGRFVTSLSQTGSEQHGSVYHWFCPQHTSSHPVWRTAPSVFFSENEGPVASS